MRIEGTDARTATMPRVSLNPPDNEAVNGAVKDAAKKAVGDVVKKEDSDKSGIGLKPVFERSDLSEKTVINTIEKANDAITITNRRFEYSIHEKTNEIMVKVIDADTDEVIREIPPEKILDMIAKIWELAGILVDERG